MNYLIDGPSRLPVTLIILGLLMRAVVAAYYADGERMLRVLSLRPRPAGEPATVYKRWDAWLAPLPFLWIWLDILVAVLLAGLVDHPLAWVALTIWVGGRMRTLQEFGHNAVHYALCPEQSYQLSHKYPFQWWLSDFFYQFPVFKGDMANRHTTHKVKHHRNPNHEKKDPNRARVHDGGMVAPMSRCQFYLRLFYPLSPAGLSNNLVTMWRSCRANHSQGTVAVRLLSLTVVIAALYAAGGWRGIVFGWLLPVVTTYQVFAWVALLAKHRWFITESSDHPRDQEFIAGRPTDYLGVAGWLVRTFIAPTSDAYHLAHSLYPTVRWNYLPAIDRFLKVNDPRYTRHASQGFLFPRDGIPAALSELRDRLTEGKP